MALSDIAIRNAKPGAKPVKLADGAGMYPSGYPSRWQAVAAQISCRWREKLLAIGAYPEIGLGEARKRREEARELIASGKDPSREKQRDKVRSAHEARNTFNAIAIEYCAKRRRDGERRLGSLHRQPQRIPPVSLNGSIGQIGHRGDRTCRHADRCSQDRKQGQSRKRPPHLATGWLRLPLCGGDCPAALRSDARSARRADSPQGDALRRRSPTPARLASCCA